MNHDRSNPLSLSVASALVMALSISSCGGGGGSPGAGNASLVTLTTASLADATTGVAYHQQLAATFPHVPGIFVVTGGSLPPGVTLDGRTGAIDGYPRQSGNFHVEIAARDGVDVEIPMSRDASFAESRRTFSMAVELGSPNVLPQQPPSAQYRSSYGYQIDVAGGTAPYTFAKTGGALPAGITVSPSGFLASFPTQALVHPYTFQITVTDALGKTDTETLSLDVVVLPLLILTSNVSDAAQGFAYDVPLDLASAGGGAPYTWSQVSPVGSETNLASIGMQITGSGHLTDLGAGPTSVGTYTFTVRAMDEALQIATRSLSLKVNLGPVLTTISPNRASSSGPFTVTGLNFQPGAKLYFKPGVGQSLVIPAFVSPTKLTFSAPVPTPSGGAGSVDVRVQNPDGGFHTKTAGFVFPASTVSFGAKGFVSSPLSSTGLDAADVNGDGKADLVHCGAAGMTTYAGSIASSAGGLVYLKNLGTNPPTFSATNLSGGNFTDVKFIDVNFDGTLDIVGLGQSTIQVWLNGVSPNPLGTFAAAPIVSALNTGGTPLAWPTDLAFGKFNGDQIPDIVYGSQLYSGGGYTSGRVFSMAGTGTGSFTALDAAISTMVSSPQAGYTYGIHTVACADLNNDGRSEILAGFGCGYYNGTNPAFLTSLTPSGTFGSWTQVGVANATVLYPGTQGLAVGDFLGNGTIQAIADQVGAPSYSNNHSVVLLTGSSLGTSTTLASPAGKTKCIGTADLDFDAKLDWAISTNSSGIAVYRGSTQAIVTSLDASAGSPVIGSPRTGKIVSADIDGDGKPDLLATTSYWAGEGMAGNYGSTYTLTLNGDGGSMGIVFYLNTSN